MRDDSADGMVDILLAEDNPGDIRLIQEAFREASIEPVFHTAADGQQTIAFLENHREDEVPYPDLLLLDLNMPRKDGFDVLEELRENPAYPPLPVIVLTSSEAREDVIRSYDLAANAYLRKPSSPDQFVSLVRAIESFWIHEAKLPSLHP